MGWSGGSEIAEPIIRAIKKCVKDETSRHYIYDRLIDAFENGADCDTLCECKGIDPVFDKFFSEDEE